MLRGEEEIGKIVEGDMADIGDRSKGVGDINYRTTNTLLYYKTGNIDRSNHLVGNWHIGPLPQTDTYHPYGRE